MCSSDLGWDISVEQDVEGSRIRFALRHRGGPVYGLSDYISFDYMVQISRAVLRDITIPIVNIDIVKKIYIQVHSMPDMNSFEPLDANPTYITGSIQSIEDFKIFQSKAPTEILVEPDNVNQMLDMILSRQSPTQKRLREKYLKEKEREDMSKQIVHAKILSLVA